MKLSLGESFCRPGCTFPDQMRFCRVYGYSIRMGSGSRNSPIVVRSSCELRFRYGAPKVISQALAGAWRPCERRRTVAYPDTFCSAQGPGATSQPKLSYGYYYQQRSEMEENLQANATRMTSGMVWQVLSMKFGSRSSQQEPKDCRRKAPKPLEEVL
jgi:hypothetical protein